MDNTISVIMPAFRAEATIGPAVRSVLAQTYADWRLIIIADDGKDYQAYLAGLGLVDDRFVFLDSGGTARGVGHTRNKGLEAVTSNYVALLDADDCFKPEKLAQSVAALASHGLVSSALELADGNFRPLGLVANGPDRSLPAREHKWLNFSGDSTIAWDRRKADGRYDPTLPNLSDLDLLLQLYRGIDSFHHLGTPLYTYVKLPKTMSNGPGVTQRMVAAKTLLLERLQAGYYPLADPQAAEYFARFLMVSLEAESSFEAALAASPGLTFEAHLQPRLALARRDLP